MLNLKIITDNPKSNNLKILSRYKLACVNNLNILFLAGTLKLLRYKIHCLNVQK